MGKKVVIRKVIADKLLPGGRLVKEEDTSLVIALFSIASVKVTKPDDVITAAKVRQKIVLLDDDSSENRDLILEDAEFNYLNDLIDPKSGTYSPDLIMTASIAPLIEMFRAATDITLKEDDKKG